MGRIASIATPMVELRRYPFTRGATFPPRFSAPLSETSGWMFETSRRSAEGLLPSGALTVVGKRVLPMRTMRRPRRTGRSRAVVGRAAPQGRPAGQSVLRTP